MKNNIDSQFYELIQFLQEHTDQVYPIIRDSYLYLNEVDQANIENYYNTFNFWGKLSRADKNFEALSNRAQYLCTHTTELIRLYKLLSDYTSKKTLLGILRNWAFFDFDIIGAVKSNYQQYWDLDIFPDGDAEVLVDCGAFTGDSIGEYISTYGINFRKIYAFEPDEDNYRELIKNTENLGKMVSPRKTGTGAEHKFCGLSAQENKSATQLSSVGTNIEIVALDEDLDDIPTFIKMDIEGAEYDTILGAKNIIATDKPKLAICLYHGYEDLTRLPELIRSINPNYKFYLRHYGGNLIPTEFVLLCK